MPMHSLQYSTIPESGISSAGSPVSSYSPYSSDSPATPNTMSTPGSPASSYVNLDVDEPCPIRYENIIFDLGDVLFTWSAVTNPPVPPKMLKRILRSVSWFEYEKGNVSEQEAYDAAAAEFDLRVEDVRRAFGEARASLRSNKRLVALIRELKAQRGVRVFAMSNISVPDLEYLRGRDRKSVV